MNKEITEKVEETEKLNDNKVENINKQPDPLVRDFVQNFQSTKKNSSKLIEKLVKNSVNILKDRESILVIVFILLTFVILAVLPNNLKLSLGILNFIIYFYLSKREDKLEMIITVLIIVIGGMITESSIIYFSNMNKNANTHTLTYNLPSNGLNIPIWLSIPYISFCVGIIHLYKIIMKYSQDN